MFLIHIVYILLSLTGIIYACVLFTNAIEHLGARLKLGNNAVGSILAVIGTTLPETIVPIVALFGAYVLKKETTIGIAQGAIIGSPFMLSTFALFLISITIFIMYLLKKRQKLELEVNCENIVRNYRYFLCAYCVMILSSFIGINHIRYLLAVFLIIFYGVYVYRTLIKSKKSFVEEEKEDLIILKLFKNYCPDNFSFVIIQIVISLFALVLFSHYFVNEIEYFSETFKISSVLLSLFVTPYATELPECINSIIWTKNKKDDLAIANVVGAIIFQSMIPASIGMLFTPWVLGKDIIVNAIFVIVCSLIFVLSILKFKKVHFFPLFICVIFYLGYFGYLIFK